MKNLLPLLAASLVLLTFHKTPAQPIDIIKAPKPKLYKMVTKLDAFTATTVTPLALEPYPVAAPGSFANTYAFGNCTWWVAQRVHIPDSWGNANTWADRARAAGVVVSDTPFVGTIAQSTGGFLGHVAIVEAVVGNQVEVSEMNVRGLNVVDNAWYPVNYFNNYIYI